MRHIHDAQTGFLSLVGEIQHATAVGELLDREALATVAVAVEVVVADERDVLRFRSRLCVRWPAQEKDR